MNKTKLAVAQVELSEDDIVDKKLEDGEIESKANKTVWTFIKREICDVDENPAKLNWLWI